VRLTALAYEAVGSLAVITDRDAMASINAAALPPTVATVL
jgi:hypothetical protein